MSTGAERIAVERAAHTTREGWTPQHDARHPAGELARAGTCYAEHAAAQLRAWGEPSAWQAERFAAYRREEPPEGWPWERVWWKPRDPMRDLERAGALMAAEIDREEFKRAPAEPAST